jgi:uncharacterized membrane protein YgcG
MTAAVMDDRLFVDGVMARIANEPLPTPARALRLAVATLDAGLAAGATWTAWHLATSRNTSVRRGMRVRSALLVALLMTLLAIGTTLAAAGATVVVRQFVDDHFVPRITSYGGQNRPDEDGLPVIVPPTSTPGTRSADDDPTDGPDEDVTDEPGGDHGSGDDDSSGGSPGHGGGSGGDEDSSGDDEDNSGGDDGSGADEDSGDSDEDAGDDEDSPDPSESPEAGDEDDGGEAAEPTDAPDDDGSSDDDDSSSDDDSSDDGGEGGDGGGED